MQTDIEILNCLTDPRVRIVFHIANGTAERMPAWCSKEHNQINKDFDTFRAERDKKCIQHAALRLLKDTPDGIVPVLGILSGNIESLTYLDLCESTADLWFPDSPVNGNYLRRHVSGPDLAAARRARDGDALQAFKRTVESYAMMKAARSRDVALWLVAVLDQFGAKVTGLSWDNLQKEIVRSCFSGIEQTKASRQELHFAGHLLSAYPGLFRGFDLRAWNAFKSPEASIIMSRYGHTKGKGLPTQDALAQELHVSKQKIGEAFKELDSYNLLPERRKRNQSL